MAAALLCSQSELWKCRRFNHVRCLNSCRSPSLFLQMHKWVNAANPCNWSWICFQGSCRIWDANISHQTCQRRNPPLRWTVEYYHDLHQALLLNICWHRCSGSCPLTCCTSTLWASWLADELPRQVCVCVCVCVCAAPPSGQSFRSAELHVGNTWACRECWESIFLMQRGMMGMCVTGALQGVRADLRASTRRLQECIVSLL